MNPFSSGTRLRDLKRAICACKTAAEERAVMRKECASIQAAIGENDQDYRHCNLAKLMFIHMLGYPMHFIQMECLKLIASPGFPEKRIGYLGLMLLLDESQEVLMLVTNSIKQDLNHTKQYIVGLALCTLGNICSAGVACDLGAEVERLIQFRDPNISKKFHKFLQLHLDPASDNTLPPSGNRSITQNLRISNTQQGKRSLVMPIHINYKANDRDVLEEGQINNFPRDL